MVNHPGRSQKSLDAAIRRLITSRSLQEISITATRAGFSVRAMPDAFHPLVAERRRAAFEGREDVTMLEAREINERVMDEVAKVFGETLEGAIGTLALTLPNTKGEG